MSKLPLTIGGIKLVDFEIPEILDSIQGMQYTEIHDFPGGTRTIQTYGAFRGPIKWSGYLTGSNALSRSVYLDQLRQAGQLIAFSYGPYNMAGVLTEFTTKPHHQWLIPYNLEFVPQQDLSSGTPNTSLLTSLSQVFSEQTVLMQEIIANAAIAVSEFSLPSNMVVPLQNVVITCNQAMLNANGNVQGMSATDISGILAAINAFEALSPPWVASNDGTQASPVLEALSSIGSILTILDAQPTLVTTLRVSNPNLPLLAQQYYGDATEWEEIAQANGLFDPLPVGQFNLVIPALSSQ